MRFFWAGALAVSCLVGHTGLVLAQTGEDEPRAKKNKGWFSNLWNPFQKKKAKTKKKKKSVEDSPPSVSKQQIRAIKIARAKAKLLRRQRVCTKLREIAYRNNDKDLMRKADQLDARAFDAFQREIGGVPVSAQSQQLLHVSEGGTSSLDEAMSRIRSQKAEAENAQHLTPIRVHGGISPGGGTLP